MISIIARLGFAAVVIISALSVQEFHTTNTDAAKANAVLCFISFVMFLMEWHSAAIRNELKKTEKTLAKTKGNLTRLAKDIHEMTAVMSRASRAADDILEIVG